MAGPFSYPALSKVPPLRNERHERFAKAVAEGAPKRQAAIDAGFSSKSAATTASQILANTKVSARISELKAEAVAARLAPATSRPQPGVEGPDLTRVDRLLLEIDALAHSDIRQLFKTTNEALTFLRPNEWPDLIAKAVSSVKIKEYPLKRGEMEWSPADSEELAQLAETVMAPEGKRILAKVREALDRCTWDKLTITEVRLWPKTAAQKMAGDARGVFQNISDLTDDELAALEIAMLNRAAERRRRLMKAV